MLTNKRKKYSKKTVLIKKSKERSTDEVTPPLTSEFFRFIPPYTSSCKCSFAESNVINNKKWCRGVFKFSDFGPTTATQKLASAGSGLATQIGLDVSCL